MFPSKLLIISIIICIFQFQVYETNAEIPRGYVEGSNCKRTCNGTKLKCYFEFEIENFFSMGKPCYQCPNVTEDCFRKDCIIAGGVERSLTVANRQLPGPAIHVCRGDRVRVLVKNHLETGESTAIHWHGMHLTQDQYMDGVPFVTQCPILVHNSFTYDFLVEITGTHFWHSHFKNQRGEGLFGSLIVRDVNSKDPHRSLYDYDLSEHVMMVGDWSDTNRLDLVQEWAMNNKSLRPTGILINGLGYQTSGKSVPNTPLPTFTVEKGGRYRLRLIGTGFVNCPVQMTFDNHTMTVIAADGFDIQPVEVESLVINPGERYDFIINADQKADTYWIRYKGFVSCRNDKIIGVAKLKYNNTANDTPKAEFPTYETAVNSTGKILNPMSVINADTPIIEVSDLKALTNLETRLATEKPTKQFYLSFEMNIINTPKYNKHPYYGDGQVGTYSTYTAQINHISHKSTPFALLPQRNLIRNNDFCNENTVQGNNCTKNLCSCTHVIQVDLHDMVEIIFIEPQTQNDLPVFHPIHLHGYNFRVVGMGYLGANVTTEQVKQMDRDGLLERNLVDAPLRDTVNVLRGGYTIIRFVANNPGFWFFHCHIEIHTNDGMELVLHVGKHNQMPKVPKGFPTCGNYEAKRF